MQHRQSRAERIGFADVLQARVADEAAERVEEVNRSFIEPVVVGGYAPVWHSFCSGRARHVAAKDTLSLDPGSADLVVHALALHKMNDPVGQLVQARAALRPDGLFLAGFLGGETLAELRAAFAEAEAAVRGGLAPRIAPMTDVRSAGQLLQRAGFALPVADRSVVTITYATPLHLMHDLRAMGETNPLAAQERGFLRRDVLAAAMEIYRDRYSTEDGRIRATFEFVYLTGWAPAASQPKALRPGSAKTRLADALKVPEHPLGRDT